jgi:hypothetical protein
MDDIAAAAEAASLLPWSLPLQCLVTLPVAWVAYRAVERFWLRPQRLSRALRVQGLSGPAYRFPVRDLTEIGRQNNEARSRPMPPCHDVAPRVLPHVLNTVKEHGMFSDPDTKYISESCNVHGRSVLNRKISGESS